MGGVRAYASPPDRGNFQQLNNLLYVANLIQRSKSEIRKECPTSVNDTPLPATRKILGKVVSRYRLKCILLIVKTFGKYGARLDTPVEIL